ncbi:MAG: glycosyltransferase [Deltaproteobacteria bacterium]|nr:glycosyltransferase [Deltaproteobacteria bacterium]
MKLSIITPNRNGDRFLEEAIQSILSQKTGKIDLEYIFIDGDSTDASLAVAEKYRDQISIFISEPDNGPVDAINKGLSLASGDILAWLNSDDRYHKNAFQRVANAFAAHPEKALCFGRCCIIDEEGREIRQWITRFKEAFFPVTSRFAIQCLNFVSQPTLFFTRKAMEAAGRLREDLVAAWDYDFVLRLWNHGGAICLKAPAPIADFRWHHGSISGRHYAVQFKEEVEAAKRHAGALAPQTLIHHCVRWGIVGIYFLMASNRR